jgi:UrcA family protein
MIKTALFAVAAAVATIAATAPVLANDIAVSYKDLDLTTPEGQSKLARRLDVAARNACGMDEARTGTRMPAQSATACYKQAQARSKNTMATIVGDAQRGG